MKEYITRMATPALPAAKMPAATTPSLPGGMKLPGPTTTQPFTMPKLPGMKGGGGAPNALGFTDYSGQTGGRRRRRSRRHSRRRSRRHSGGATNLSPAALPQAGGRRRSRRHTGKARRSSKHRKSRKSKRMSGGLIIV
jgi:hypothetical protein